jgi:hypothetical protein
MSGSSTVTAHGSKVVSKGFERGNSILQSCYVTKNNSSAVITDNREIKLIRRYELELNVIVADVTSPSGTESSYKLQEKNSATMKLRNTDAIRQVLGDVEGDITLSKVRSLSIARIKLQTFHPKLEIFHCFQDVRNQASMIKNDEAVEWDVLKHIARLANEQKAGASPPLSLRQVICVHSNPYLLRVSCSQSYVR